MDIAQPLTIRAGTFPRAWVPTRVRSASAPSPKNQRKDAALLAQVSALCARSYKLTPQTFVTDSTLNWASRRQGFDRRGGRFLWRPLALVLMPVNYVAILFWLVGLLLPLLVVGAVTEFLLDRQTGLWIHPFTWILTTLPTWLFWLGLLIGAVGFAIGAVIAFKSRAASGRAFGLVDPATQRAIVIFFGSAPSDNLTLNVLIWPYFFPMRHMGFHRAWDHIRPEVRQWLQDVVSEGQVTEVVIAGHSLGGALAQVAACDLAAEFPVGHVISLGSACIGGAGMQKRVGEREVHGGGGLNGRMRHFTYTGDVMPRIPPISIFRHVGKRYCLPAEGGPIEGTEEGIIKSFGRFFVRMMSAFALFFLKTASKFKLMKILKLPYDENGRFGPNAFVGDGTISIFELFRSLVHFLMTFPLAIPYAVFLAAIALTVFPIAVLVMMYGYVVSVFKSGLLVQHAAANYRDAFQRYLTSLGPDKD